MSRKPKKIKRWRDSWEKTQHYIIQTSSQVRITNLQKNTRNKERLQSQDEWVTGPLLVACHHVALWTMKALKSLAGYLEILCQNVLFYRVNQCVVCLPQSHAMKTISINGSECRTFSERSTLSSAFIKTKACLLSHRMLYYKLHIGKSEVFIEKKVLEAGL